MSGTGGTVTLDCPTDVAVECFKIPGYRYASYDNSAATPCGTSSVNGTVTGVCARPNVSVTSWLINGRNVLADPVNDGWDNCAVPFLNDFATTLNQWDPFAGNWTVLASQTCAYFVRSRALPASGIEYGTLTATDNDTGETLTFEPVQTVVPDEYYRRIVQITVTARPRNAGPMPPGPSSRRPTPIGSSRAPRKSPPSPGPCRSSVSSRVSSATPARRPPRISTSRTTCRR